MDFFRTITHIDFGGLKTSIGHGSAAASNNLWYATFFRGREGGDHFKEGAGSSAEKREILECVL